MICPLGVTKLRIVLSDGSKFGRAVVPVQIEPYDDTKLMLSSIFLFKRYRIAAVAAKEAEKINLAPAYVPLVSQDIEITPTDNPTFSGGGKIPVYFQIYGPGREPAQTVEVNLRIVDAKTGKFKRHFCRLMLRHIEKREQIGSPCISFYRLATSLRENIGWKYKQKIHQDT
ncbi:MAG TPA: hypothetical protein VG897_19340 [Terriglobales bacterium]|nr:hypothetical protein [Terriglobales bacterium]